MGYLIYKVTCANEVFSSYSVFGKVCVSLYLAQVHVGYFPGCFRYIVRPSKAGSDCPVVFLPGLGGRAEHAWDIPDRQCKGDKIQKKDST